MKTVISVDYDPDKAETAFRFSASFAQLPPAVQMDIAVETQQRMQALAASLEAIITRASAGNS